MRFYLAARYSRLEELNQYKRDLESLGHTVVARWLSGNHQITEQHLVDTDTLDAYSQEQRERFALEDIADIVDVDAIINFTEIPRTGYTRGGRHVEFGVGYALEKELYIVGPREHVFHCLPGVEHFESWEECVDHLRGTRREYPEAA